MVFRHSEQLARHWERKVTEDNYHDSSHGGLRTPKWSRAARLVSSQNSVRFLFSFQMMSVPDLFVKMAAFFTQVNQQEHPRKFGSLSRLYRRLPDDCAALQARSNQFITVTTLNWGGAWEGQVPPHPFVLEAQESEPNLNCTNKTKSWPKKKTKNKYSKNWARENKITNEIWEPQTFFNFIFFRP